MKLINEESILKKKEGVIIISNDTMANKLMKPYLCRNTILSNEANHESSEEERNNVTKRKWKRNNQRK